MSLLLYNNICSKLLAKALQSYYFETKNEKKNKRKTCVSSHLSSEVMSTKIKPAARRNCTTYKLLLLFFAFVFVLFGSFELYKLRLSLVLLFRISCLLTLILVLPPFLFVQKSHAWRSFAILSTVPHILGHLCDGEKTIRGFARNNRHLQNQMGLACASQPSN